MADTINAYKILVGKPLGKGSHGISRLRYYDHIKIDLGKTGCEGVESIHLSQDRDQWRALVNTVMNIRIP
jgi:hypothetical protein